MKKTLRAVAIVVTLSILAAFASAGTKNVPFSKEKTKIVRLCNIEWDSVKKEVDSKGVCVLEEHDIVIVVTNPIPPVVHYFSYGENRLRNNDRKEPVPYEGQGL